MDLWKGLHAVVQVQQVTHKHGIHPIQLQRDTQRKHKAASALRVSMRIGHLQRGLRNLQ